MNTDYLKAHRIKDLPGLPVVMAHMFPNRTDCEAYLDYKLDITNLLKYIEEKNKGREENKLTLFHCLLYAISKMLYERPKMNRYIQGHKFFQREYISLAFIVRRRFHDNSEESLMLMVPENEWNVEDIRKKVTGEVREVRKSETANGGIDDTLDAFASMPHLLLMFVARVVRWLDFWSLVPKSLQAGDSNFSSVFLTNLGSVKCPAVYHHLNNYGSNSVMVAIGLMHKEQVVNQDESVSIRDVVDIGVTLDERIGDGFYFARSLKIIDYICQHPEMLDQPISTPSNVVY